MEKRIVGNPDGSRTSLSVHSLTNHRIGHPSY